MKLWLIKFGKVWALIRREGVLVGIKRAGVSLWATLKMMP